MKYSCPLKQDIKLTTIFKALGDPVRLDLIKYLQKVHVASCSELLQGRAKSTMSHHFKILRESGLLMSEVKGNLCLNRLRYDDLEERFPGLLETILKNIN